LDESVVGYFRNKIDKRLEELSSQSSPYFPNLYEGARYSLNSGGKRIRPLLTLAALEMIQENSHEKALDPACALEMVHTYSLIHDDLPCMDDDDFRRGKPTLHRVYNEGHAVLVGDFLLTYAFEVLSNAPFLTSDQKIALVAALSKGAGGEGMVGGQVMDLERSSYVQEIHLKKTAALFVVALKFAGIISTAPSPLMKKLEDFGLLFGEIFQLVDDLLDHDHPLGEEKAKKALGILYLNVQIALKEFPGNSDLLSELVFLVMNQVEHQGVCVFNR